MACDDTVVATPIRRFLQRTSLVTNSLRRFSIAALAVGTLVAGLAGPGMGIAQAAPAATDDERVAGLWYADRLKLDDLAAQGATGAGIKIAVIDAAINLDAAELQGANITVKGSYCAFPETGETVPAISTDVERAGHGTDVVAMLVGNGKAADGGPGTRGIVPDAEVWFYASGMPEDQTAPDAPGCEEYDAGAKEFYADKGLDSGDTDYFLGSPDAYAAWHAVNDGADIIVYSIVGGDIFGWSKTQIKALRAGVPIVAGSKNPDGDLAPRYYPYQLNGVVSVSGVDNDSNLLHGGYPGDTFRSDAMGSPNFAFLSAASAILSTSGEDGWKPSIAHGTSLATPLVAGTIAIGMQKFPDASANQVLQAMTRTTGNAGIHDPDWLDRQWGYGIANPTGLLASNPTDYPDENPLFVLDIADPRCVFSDGSKVEGMEGIEGCAFAISPSSEQVWPSSEAPNSEPTKPAQDEPTPGDTPQETTLSPTLLFLGGMALVVAVAAAITVPVFVVRSRKRKRQVPPDNFDESQMYRG